MTTALSIRRPSAAVLAALYCLAALDATARESVVLLAGGESSSASDFHRAAEAYYRAQANGDRINTVLRAESFADAREQLASHPARGDQPWGDVIIVAHGSQWVGLSLPLFDPGEPPARASVIARAMANGEFPPLRDDVLDNSSRLILESCGVGRRTDLLSLYSRLLGGNDDQRPDVVASPGLVEFSATRQVDGHMRFQRVEHPYRAELLAGPPSAASDTRHRTALQQWQRKHHPLDSHWPSWQVMPVNLDITIDASSAVGIREPARLLPTVPAVREALIDHDLDPRRLQWQLRCTANGQCQASARGRLVSLSPVSLPTVPLPQASP